MGRIFEFKELDNARLIVDALYKGGRNGDASDEPLTKILSVPKCYFLEWTLLEHYLSGNDWD